MVGLYHQDGTRRGFLLETNTGGNGGASGSGDSGATGSSGAGGGDEKIVTPFDSIDLNEFDEDTRNKLTQAKTDFVATLQQSRKTEAELIHERGLARRFQSTADRQQKELEKLQPRHREEDVDPYLEIAKAELKAAKYPEDQIEKLAPMFANMAKRTAEVQRQTIGRDLGPMASTVLATEAQNSFQTAQHTDRTGVFQIPEVNQMVWNLVTKRMSEGQSTSPEIVASLGKMVFMDYYTAERDAGRDVKLPNGSAPPPPPGMNTAPAFNYPGFGPSHIRPAIPSIRDPKAARTELNEDTHNALAQTFKHLQRDTNVAPKAFTAKIK